MAHQRAEQGRVCFRDVAGAALLEDESPRGFEGAVDGREGRVPRVGGAEDPV